MTELLFANPVSTAVKYLAWGNDRLFVRTHTDPLGYTYEDVKESAFRAFVTAPSVGRHWNAVVKGYYAPGPRRTLEEFVLDSLQPRRIPLWEAVERGRRRLPSVRNVRVATLTGARQSSKGTLTNNAWFVNQIGKDNAKRLGDLDATDATVDMLKTVFGDLTVEVANG